jgi:hypothetical protein
MDLNQFANPELLALGGGIFAANFIFPKIVDKLSGNPQVGDWADYIGNGLLIAAGSLLIAKSKDKNLKSVGMAVGAVGVSNFVGMIYNAMTKGAN